MDYEKALKQIKDPKNRFDADIQALCFLVAERIEREKKALEGVKKATKRLKSSKKAND